ncbi:polysaccharide lyase beta-sandwich domain-containing protein [Paenibacillus sp. P26]|nr:polysaccharide lyase beta-sandwich domain-containing protein [Paenibacillus sp. P26]
MRADPDFTVLENSADVQAVKEKRLGIVGANFWNDAPKTVQADGADWLSSNAKASVMTKEAEGRLELSLADPTQSRTSPIELEVFRAAVGVMTADPRITVKRLSPTVQLSVDPGGTEGGTVKAVFSLTSGPDGVPPSKPADLSAEPVSYNQIRLKWTPSSDASGVAGYKIYRNGAYLTTVYSPGYTDTGLAAETSYEYTVQAFDPSGLLSEPGGPVSAATLKADLYVIRDNFDSAVTGTVPSGYTIDSSGGSAEIAEVPSAANKSLKLADTSGTKAVVASKPLGVQKLTLPGGIQAYASGGKRLPFLEPAGRRRRECRNGDDLQRESHLQKCVRRRYRPADRTARTRGIR